MERSNAGSILTLLMVLSFGMLCAAQQRPTSGPVKGSASFPQVELLIQQNRFDEAKAAMLEELQRTPSSTDGYDLLGIIESNQQDFAGAEGSFKKALQLSPNSTRAHNNLGNVYVVEKKLDMAEKEFRTVLRVEPANRDGNYNLGVLLMSKDLPAEAVPHFQRIHPTDLPTSLNLIRAYLKTNRGAEAQRLAAQLSEQNKENVEVHFSLGVLLASEKQYAAARSELERADTLRSNTFEILFNLGQAYLRNKEYPKADLALTRAIHLKPDSSDALYLLAQVCAGESRPLDALDFLVRAHKLAPQDTNIIFLMAQISISQNYFEDAIPLLESGLQIAPQRSDLRAALGESYFMSGKVDKSIEQFEKLIAAEPSARSYSFLGLSYRHLGRFDEATKYLRMGLKLEPHNSSCLYNLGFIAERQGDAAGAEVLFQEILRYNPDFPEALLELANLRIAAKKLPEAAELLRKYVKISHDPATGYYKLAMVERSLHDTAAANRDLGVFQTLSKDVSTGPYPYEHLFDYIDNRSKLAPGARDQLDLTELSEQIKKHPDQPADLYLLAEAYLKAHKLEEARDTVAQLDKISSGDYRTQTEVGVLLARFHLYEDAIRHFQSALQLNPDQDEVKFNLANAYFRKGRYAQALDSANQVSGAGRKDDAYSALLGDIYTHLGDTARAEQIFRDAINRNPDNDQDYLSLSLIEFRQNHVADAKQILLKGQARVPGSGKLLWGLGIASALEGNNEEALDRFERAVELLPEWPGSYSTLGVFYFQTGQIDKAKEVLNRFKSSTAVGGLDVNRIEQMLAQAQPTAPAVSGSMSMADRVQLLQFALALADKTL